MDKLPPEVIDMICEEYAIDDHNHGHGWPTMTPVVRLDNIGLQRLRLVSRNFARSAARPLFREFRFVLDDPLGLEVLAQLSLSYLALTVQNIKFVLLEEPDVFNRDHKGSQALAKEVEEILSRFTGLTTFECNETDLDDGGTKDIFGGLFLAHLLRQRIWPKLKGLRGLHKFVIEALASELSRDHAQDTGAQLLTSNLSRLRALEISDWGDDNAEVEDPNAEIAHIAALQRTRANFSILLPFFGNLQSLNIVGVEFEALTGDFILSHVKLTEIVIENCEGEAKDLLAFLLPQKKSLRYLRLAMLFLYKEEYTELFKELRESFRELRRLDMDHISFGSHCPRQRTDEEEKAIHDLLKQVEANAKAA